MNHIPMRMNAPAIRPQKMTRRAMAKQQTREKVLQAARELFIERGYEGATIRDIAKAAGMSTGAVFASFADKSELFEEILTADYEVIYAQMTQASRNAKTVDEADGRTHRRRELRLAHADSRAQRGGRNSPLGHYDGRDHRGDPRTCRRLRGDIDGCRDALLQFCD